MTIYIIHCYNNKNDKYPCLYLEYKRKNAAYKRAEKARAVFGRVDVLSLEV